jgi:hypothetical protein
MTFDDFNAFEINVHQVSDSGHSTSRGGLSRDAGHRRLNPGLPG